MSAPALWAFEGVDDVLPSCLLSLLSATLHHTSLEN